MDLNFLAYLACPVGMGLMMWMMMRGGSSRGKSETDGIEGASGGPIQAGRPAEASASSAGSGGVWQFLGLCLDRRVLVALGAVGVAMLVLAPSLLLPALPVLLLAACPLSMLLMMWRMRRGQTPIRDDAGLPSPTVPAPTIDRRTELEIELETVRNHEEALRSEIASLSNGPLASENGRDAERAEARS